jgi:membrane protease YdiL (CAAX protease family)
MDQPVLPARQSLIRRLPPVPFALAVLVVIFLTYQLAGGVVTFLLFGGKVIPDNVSLMRWATLGGQILFLLVPTVLIARLRPPGPGFFFRWRIPDYREIILVCIAVFALQQVLQVYLMVQDTIPLPGPVRQVVEEFKRLIEETYRLLVTAHSPGELGFVVLVAAVVPAVCEELLFRGVVQRSFEQGTNGLRAALITGVIFGAYHLSPFTIVPLAVLGMFFGFVLYRTDNILVSMAAHFFNNFIACLATYFRFEADMVSVIPGDVFSPIVIALNFLFFGLVFVAATYYFIRMTQRAPDARVHPQSLDAGEPPIV